MAGQTRKCSICKGEIILSEMDLYICEELKVGNKYTHVDCFITKRTSGKLPWTEAQCLEYIEQQQSKTKSQIEHKRILDNFYRWIMEAYEIECIHKNFFLKIARILNGTWEGLRNPVKIEDLFDMWQRGKVNLDKIHIKNQTNNKKINSSNRLDYDLAIIMNKYNSYLEWKRKKEAEKKELELRVLEQKEYLPLRNNMNQYVNEIANISRANLYDIINEI